MNYKLLKDCLLLWIEEHEESEPLKCKISPGETVLNVVQSIKNNIHRIEQVPSQDRKRSIICKVSKNALLKIYKAIQEPENFNVQEKEKFNFENFFTNN